MPAHRALEAVLGELGSAVIRGVLYLSGEGRLS